MNQRGLKSLWLQKPTCVSTKVAVNALNAAATIFAEVTITNHKVDKLNSVPTVGKSISQASIPYARIAIGISNQNRRNQGEWPQPDPQALPSALDRLLRKIESVKRVITENPQSVRDSERATEMFCVIPIVSGLGWDVESPQDIVPQQRIPQGRRRADLRVDFAMQINGVPVVFVEVKRHSDYYNPEWDQQLRKYADYMESGYGVLTNGQTWMTYTVDGDQTTHISTVDIIKEKEEAAAHLHKYLSKRGTGCASTDSSARAFSTAELAYTCQSAIKTTTSVRPSPARAID